MNFFQMRRITEMTAGELARIERNENYGYRSISGAAEDWIDGNSQSSKVIDSKTLYSKNPLANNIIETMIDYSIGDGVKYKAVDEKVQDILDEYWCDLDNDWDYKMANRFRDLAIYGELIIVPFVAEHTGKVKITTLYPGNIGSVIIDELNPERIVSFIYGDRTMPVIRWDDRQNDYFGEAFFYQINKTTHQSRGDSDLYSSRDWLQLYDKALYSTAERVGLLLSFIWDVTLTNANAGDCAAKLKQILHNPPKPGSAMVHNEKETWKAETPGLAANELETFFNLIRSQPMAGARHPKLLFGQDENANRASAYVIMQPYFKKAKRRQQVYRKIIEDQFDYVIWQAEKRGLLNGVEDKSYQIVMPEPNPDIADALSTTLQTYANSISILQTGGYLTRKEARALVSMVVGQLGIETGGEEEEAEGEQAYDYIAAKLRAHEAKVKRK